MPRPQQPAVELSLFPKASIFFETARDVPPGMEAADAAECDCWLLMYIEIRVES